MTEPAFLRAARAAYDTVATDYADQLRDLLADSPFDRSVLAAFADLVRADGGGPVADLGCGPGRITGHLASLGLDVSGIDLSPEMVRVARREHPGLRFDEGSMLALELADAGLAGAVAWYSVIHTPPDHLPAMFAEFHRVLRPGGRLVLAFQVGDGPKHLDHGYGHDISLDAHRLPPDGIADLLGRAGLAVHARLLRDGEGWEPTPQAYLFARRAAG